MARDAFKKALAIVPDDAEICAYIAMAHLRLSCLSDAATSARQALKLDPDSKLAKEVLDTAEESPRSKAAQEESPEDSEKGAFLEWLLFIGYLMGKCWWVISLVFFGVMLASDKWDFLLPSWLFHIALWVMVVSWLCRFFIVGPADEEDDYHK